MASKAIKGITIEIGGDTTKLGKALESTEKKSRSLQNELRQVEKLLKFDPTNTELLIQKQNVLADIISETTNKLNTLKNAEAEVVAQFEKGEIGEEQLRAFQREIMQTEKSLNDMKTELQVATRNLEEFGDNNGVAKEATAKLEREIQEQNDALEAEKKALQEAEQAQKEHEKAVAEAKEELADFGEKAEEAYDKVKTGVTVLGGAVVAGGGYALKLSTDFDQAFNTLITRTGASKEEMDGLNQAMENVYANNFGDSIQDVAESMATVKTNTKLSGDELQSATEKALLMRDTFEFDVNESTRSAKMLMDQYGISAEEAYNLIAQGAQNGLDKNGDLLDTINEYGVHFSGLGLSAEDMFNMLVNGAENGTFSVDKLGDSVKEFGIRVKDGTADNAFKELGFDVDETKKKFAQGGEGAKKSLQDVTTALFKMKDPVKQNQLGVELFGTMWEDLGVEGVKALMNLEGEVSNSKNALDEINNQKYDDIGSALQGLGRTLQTDVVKPLGEELKPVVEDAISYVQANGPQIKEILSNVVDKVGEFVGFVVDNGPTILSVIAGIGAGFAVWNIVQTIVGVVSAIKAFTTATEGASLAMKIFNAIGKTNVFILIASVIATVIVAIVTFIATNEDARAKFIEIWNKVKEFCGNVIGAIGRFFTETIPKALDTMITFFKALPGKIQTWLTNTINKVSSWASKMKTKATDTGSKFINAVVNFFKKLPGQVWTWLVNVVSKVTTWASNIVSKAKNAGLKFINAYINFVKQLPGKVWSFLSNVISKVASWASNMISKAKNAGSKFVSSVVNLIKGLPSKIWTWLSNTASKVVSWGTSLASKGKQAGKKLLDAVVNKAKEIPKKILSVGKDIVSGLWKGIGDKVSWLKGKIKSFVGNVTDWLKSFFKIKSPSRVMKDEIGKYISEGIGVGITENEDKPIGALEDLGDDMMDTAKNINGITLDRQLRHTFGGSVSPDTNILDRLDNIIKKLESKTQIFLDTGTLVGETLDAYDKAFADRKTQLARGW